MGLEIGLLIGLAGGGVATFVIQKVFLKNKSSQLVREAEVEGENIKKEKILQAKEKFLKLKEEHETTMKDKERRLQSTEDRVKAKEKTLSQKIEEVSRKEKEFEKNQSELELKVQSFDLKHQELEKIQEKRVAELSRISGMTAEDAKNHLMEALYLKILKDHYFLFFVLSHFFVLVVCL
jgi:ribonuclease Y